MAEGVEPEEETLRAATTHDTAAAAPNHRKDGEGSIEQRLSGICIIIERIRKGGSPVWHWISTEKGLKGCSCIIIEKGLERVNRAALGLHLDQLIESILYRYLVLPI